MKRTTAVLLALTLLFTTFLSHDAAARSRAQKQKLSDKRTEKTEEMRKPRRFDRMPTMDFHQGKLRQGAFAGWSVEGVKVQLARNCVIEDNGVTGATLEEGRPALIMGPRFGDTIIAWQVRMLDADYGTTRPSAGMEVKASEVNPAVGEIIKAPR